MAVETFRYYAGWADKLTGDTLPVSGNFFTYTLREPVGVVGAIVPWNFPLNLASWKVAPALAAGCTVVLKPAHETPLTALLLGEIAVAAGLPAGALNGLDCRRRAGAPSAGRQDRLHGLDRSRSVDHARGGGDRETRDPRARRQESQHHLCRCRSAGGGARRPERDLLWKGRGVRGRIAAAGRASSARSGGRAARRAGQETRPRRSVRQEHPPGRDRVAAAAADGVVLHRGGREGRRPAGGGRQAGEGEREGLLRRGDRVRRRQARHEDRG